MSTWTIATDATACGHRRILRYPDEVLCAICEDGPCEEASCPQRLKAATVGIALIAAERRRQIEVNDWTPEHDDQHTGGELATLACYYALPCHPDEAECLFPAGWDEKGMKREGDEFQPSDHDLVKAGALIAAELDRRARAKSGGQS